jgi:hypothetical protein
MLAAEPSVSRRNSSSCDGSHVQGKQLAAVAISDNQLVGMHQLSKHRESAHHSGSACVLPRQLAGRLATPETHTNACCIQEEAFDSNRCGGDHQRTCTCNGKKTGIMYARVATATAAKTRLYNDGI